MRIINGADFSVPTTTNRRSSRKNRVRNLRKDVDQLKINDGYTDPVGEAKRQLAQALISGQLSANNTASNQQAVYQKGRRGRARRSGIMSLLTRLHNVFGSFRR